MGWGVHLFGLCIIWHTSIAEKPQSSLPLIHMNSVRPAGWGFAWSFRSFTLGVKAEGADTVSRWGWHVAQETAGCLPTGSDAAAGAVAGERTCQSARLTLFSLLASMWIMDSAKM